jgi:hypothetical protein
MPGGASSRRGSSVPSAYPEFLEEPVCRPKHGRAGELKREQASEPAKASLLL